MPLITFLTVCYQEACKQRGGDFLIDRDVSHFLTTATCIQLQASVQRLRSLGSGGCMGSFLLIPYLMSLWDLWWEPWLDRATVSVCPWSTLLFSFAKRNDFFPRRTLSAASCPQHCFFHWGVCHALEGPASCGSRVQKQPLGRQLLPLKGYQLVLLPNTPSFWAHSERTFSPKPL